MAEAKVGVIIEATDKATSTLNSVRGSLNDVSSSLGTMAKYGAAALAATGAAVVAFGVTSVKAFMDSEVAMANFNTTMNTMVGSSIEVATGLTSVTKTLKLTGTAAEEVRISIKEKTLALNDATIALAKGKISQAEYMIETQKINNQIVQLNEKLTETDDKEVALTKTIKITKEQVLLATKAFKEASEKVTQLGFDDEDAAVSMSKFFQRTGDVNQALNLNRVAMDLSRAKHIELEDAGRMVNLVLSGNARALKEYGIVLDETKSPLEAIGELHDKVRGQAEAFANTTEGKLAIMGQSWTNLKETIGAVFAPYVNQALGSIIGILNHLQSVDIAGTFELWKQKIVDFFVNLDSQFSILQFFKDSWTEIVDFFNTFLKPAWDSLTKTIYDNREMLKELFANFVKFVAMFGEGTVVAVIGGVTLAFKGLELAINVTKGAIEIISDAINGMVSLVQLALDQLAKLSAKVGLSSISGMLKSGVNALMPYSTNTSVRDAVISPSGQIISTDPQDYLIATKNPRGLSGGTSITVNVNGGTYLSKEAAGTLGDMIISQLRMQMKI